MLTEINWDDLNVRRVFIRKVCYFTVTRIKDLFLFFYLTELNYYWITVLVSGLQYLDDPAFGHSCHRGTVYLQVSPDFKKNPSKKKNSIF